MRVIVFKGKPRADGKPRLFYFRAVADNGEPVAMSEGYSRRESAVEEAMKLWPGVRIEMRNSTEGKEP